MNNPNIPKQVVEKVRWAAAVGLGFLALSGCQESSPTPQSDDSPAMEYNISANPYNLTDAERGELIEAREEACGGVFSPEECWDFTTLNPALFTTSITKFTPIIPVAGNESVSVTNDSFTEVPTYVNSGK